MNKKIVIRVLIIFFSLGIIVGAILAIWGWNIALKPNFTTNNESKNLIFVEKNENFDALVCKLEADSLVVNSNSLRKFGNLLGSRVDKIPAGCYYINPDLNNLDQVRNLIRGMQSPVNVTVNSVRMPQQLVSNISKQLLLDSVALSDFINDEEKMKQIGFTNNQLFTLFVCNTYEMWWTVSVDNFMARMKKEHDAFWNASRVEKAKKLGMSKEDVVILASIVEEESKYAPELSRIAGLYINRLKRGMLLQSDPTVKYAVGDFTLNQILYAHLEVDSPYNTYKYVGLPPSPIRLPNARTIDAVLNAESHNLFYMCASEKFDGTHNFAKTLGEHNRNAERYHQALRVWKRSQKK